MATYNFDKIINRKGTNCLKYDYAVERGKPADVLPLWVADMDFTVSEEITKSLHAESTDTPSLRMLIIMP